MHSSVPREPSGSTCKGDDRGTGGTDDNQRPGHKEGEDVGQRPVTRPLSGCSTLRYFVGYRPRGSISPEAGPLQNTPRRFEADCRQFHAQLVISDLQIAGSNPAGRANLPGMPHMVFARIAPYGTIRSAAIRNRPGDAGLNAGLGE